MEYAVRFSNRKNENLIGIIYTPEKTQANKKIGILFPVNALVYRIGSNRLNVLMARKFKEMGYYVMTFDPAGIGDSEGEFEEKPVIEHNFDIETGRHKEDTEDAINYFSENYQIDEVIIYGLCGGAISGLLASLLIPQVTGLILLGLPIINVETGVKGGQLDEAGEIVSKQQASKALIHYSKRIFQIQTWKRIFTINWENEIKVILKSIFVLLKKITNKISTQFVRKKANFFLRDVPFSDHPRYNLNLQKAFFDFLQKGGKTLFIFGELDPVTWFFMTEFKDKGLMDGNFFKDLYDIYVIKDANHIFSAEHSQEKLKELVDKWLSKHYAKDC